MLIAIVGGHGKIARRLTTLLVARGDNVRGLIRDADHADDLRAKAQADEALMASDRAWTIVRPGTLTDDPGTGRVRIDAEPFREHVPRDDVAAVLAALLPEPRSVRHILYVGRGEDDIETALAHL